MMRRFISRFGREVLDECRSLSGYRGVELVPGAELTFGPKASTRFHEVVQGCNRFLEYGSGSSTLYAAKLGVPFVTVESSPTFLAVVEQECQKLVPLHQARNQQFLLGDVGRTVQWGVPGFRLVPRPKTWRNYPLAPWAANGPNFRADVVLIDGRFRVACALAVIANQQESDWTMLIDDYVERPEYHGIESFAQLNGLHGRMAEFVPLGQFNMRHLTTAINRAFRDWR